MFRATHAVTTAGFGAAWFEQRSLPFAGGAGDQPALLMQQLEWLEHLHNEVLNEWMKEKREEQERKRRDDD